ncbi:hypothetical protein D3C87_2124230 [compost metagenome]
MQAVGLEPCDGFLAGVLVGGSVEDGEEGLQVEGRCHRQQVGKLEFPGEWPVEVSPDEDGSEEEYGGDVARGVLPCGHGTE